MREMHVICFTSQGEQLAARMTERFAKDTDTSLHIARGNNAKEWTKSVFRKDNILVYIGATGIAVRAIAPLLRSKMTDPAVIVIDEKGKFVIPILSGHVGGANRWAQTIAASINATPVITTATDINRVFAVDTFAVENGYVICNPAKIKEVSASLLEGKTVGLVSDFEVVGKLPKNISPEHDGDVKIRISEKFLPVAMNKSLMLIPKCFHVGIGAKKNASPDDLHDLFTSSLEENDIPVECVARIASVDLKKKEKAIIELAETHCIPFETYSPEQLREHESLFEMSEFVRETTGVGNVCETAAYLSANHGIMVCNKSARNGMTIAIAREHWQVRFNDLD